jgi:hypothetical protein
MVGVFEQAEKDTSTPYGMLCVPRGTFKTSIARGTVVWKQLRQIFLRGNVYHRMALASATLALSRESLGSIENQLKYNGDLTSAYGPLWQMPDKKRGIRGSKSEDAITLKPRIEQGEIAAVAEPSIWIGSSHRVSTGFHADEIVADDLNNKENTLTDTQRQKVHDYWSGLFPILNPVDRVGNPGRIMMNATPWHDDDVRGRILRNERAKAEADPSYRSKWVYIQEPAVKDGVLFFPTRLTEEVLASYEEEMGPSSFAANYLCDPVGNRGFVDEGSIHFRPRTAFPPSLRWLRITVDPNQHTKAKDLGCYAAIMVSGYDHFANLYFVDARGSRDWDSADLIDELFGLNETYPDAPILIEDAHMGHLDHAIKLEEELRSSKAGRRIHLRVQYVSPHGSSKYENWERLRPRFKNNRILFADEIHPKIKAEIKDELVRGPASRFKDFLDAMAMAEVGIRPRIARDGALEDRSLELSVASGSVSGGPTIQSMLPPELSSLLPREFMTSEQLRSRMERKLKK